MSEQRYSLDGLWQFQPVGKLMVKPNGDLAVVEKENLPPPGQMTLPANWHKAGLPNFFGRVRFSRQFTAPGRKANERIWLCFKGVDYFTYIWVNGVWVGEHTGYFAPFSFDITDHLKPGANQLDVIVDSPNSEPGTVWPHRKWLIKGILDHWDGRPGSWDESTGQDGNCGGIWNSVFLEQRHQTHISGVKVTTQLLPKRHTAHDVPDDAVGDIAVPIHPHALVTVRAQIAGPRTEKLMVEVTLGHERVAVPVPFHAEGSEVIVTLPVENARLWWTWDHGEPYLYDCMVRLLLGEDVWSEQALKVGIREIEVDRTTGQWRLNGRRIFIRGTNVIPTMWLGEYDQEMIDKDIDLLLKANINAVRVCVHVNRDELYDACDRAGILVWQDFPLQWGYAPDQMVVVRHGVIQVKEMIRSLYNHPSIAVWCCQNEANSYNTYVMGPQLRLAAQEEDATRYIHQTAEFGEHAYPGWYGGELRDYVKLPGAPMCTEFGAQALPSVERVREMGGHTWPPDWKQMAYHDFQYDQTFHVAGVEMGEGLEQFVANSQAYQAKLLKFAIEHYRRAKYTKVGSLFQFMFQDGWPAITWSVVDYYREPKQGYYALQQAYQPVLIGADLPRDKFMVDRDFGSHQREIKVSLWAVNDRPEDLTGLRCECWLEQAEGPASYAFGQIAVSLPADSVTEVGQVKLVAKRPKLGKYKLLLKLFNGEELVSQNEYPVELVAAPGQ